MTNNNILILPGDGIGPEICNEVIKLNNFLNNNSEDKISFSNALIGGIAYDKTGSPLPQETIKLAKESDAILLGAVGGYKWEELDISLRPEKGLLSIRKELDLFANLRPAIVFNELADSSALKKEIISDLDILIIRELTGGIYFGEPRGIYTKDDYREGINTLRYTDKEIIRIAKVAFNIADKRKKILCSVDKANVLESTELWREEVQKIRNSDFSNIHLEHMYVDNAAMQLISNPKKFDVILTTNMFGDILSDIAATLTGSLGMLPSASLGEQHNGKMYALYEPVHGSAPDIAGKNIANPIAMILSFAMMLEISLNRKQDADNIRKSIQNVLSENFRTSDISSSKSNIVSTSEMGDLIIKKLSDEL
jgi:3-isopropylmalate dehydrogenase